MGFLLETSTDAACDFAAGVGWMESLATSKIPRPVVAWRALLRTPWFLISSLVVAVGLRAVADRVGVVLTLIALLLVISPLPNRGHRAEVGESVEWGMLLPIAAIRLPATAIPEHFSLTPIGLSLRAFIKAGRTMQVPAAHRWLSAPWAGHQSSGGVGLTEAWLQPDSPAAARQLGLGVGGAAPQKSDPAQCLPELHDVLHQRKVVTENAFYRGRCSIDAINYLRATTRHSGFGYEHPVSSVRRPPPRFAPANAFAP